MARSLILSTAMCLICGPVLAAALEDGRDAYHKGDYATALRILRPLADQGNPDAQVFIGMSYEFGDGIAKDTKEAINWYRKAAERAMPMPSTISERCTKTAKASRRTFQKQ